MHLHMCCILNTLLSHTFYTWWNSGKKTFPSSNHHIILKPWGHDKWTEGLLRSVKQTVCKFFWYRIPSSLIMWHFRRFKNTTKGIHFHTKGGTKTDNTFNESNVTYRQGKRIGRPLMFGPKKVRACVWMESTDSSVMILRVRCQYRELSNNTRRASAFHPLLPDIQISLQSAPHSGLW